MRTLIIAEAGVNHNGDINIARQLIDIAAEAGADIIKFQTFNANRIVTASAIKADYQKQNTEMGESQYSMLHRLELTRDMHEVLIDYCKLKKIKFLSTGFDIYSIKMLKELGIDVFKIPSGEITNLPYLRHIGSYGCSIILSTGMATLNEIGSALEILQKAGTELNLITVLHCNTEYPTPMRDVNLRAMQTIRDYFGVAVGYSDHTIGIEVSIVAVAMGASVIEKHFTLDSNMQGPDHKASIEFDELKKMVSGIRNIEMALGNGEKVPSNSEKKNMSIARKSLVAACDISKGDIFNESNIIAKRPGTGLSPMLWDKIMGCKATRDFKVDELIGFNDIDCYLHRNT